MLKRMYPARCRGPLLGDIQLTDSGNERKSIEIIRQVAIHSFSGTFEFGALREVVAKFEDTADYVY